MAKVIFLIISLYLSNVQCAKILGVFLNPAISHQVVFQPIWKELSLRGHEVTVLTPNPLNDPKLVNLTEIDLSFAYETFRKGNLKDAMKKGIPTTQVTVSLYKILTSVVEAELEHPAVQDLIQDRSKTFDILLLEFLHPVMTAFSARFNCPMIGINSFSAFIHSFDLVGNPSHPVLQPDMLLPFMGNMGFSDRLYSTYFSVWFRYYYHYHVLPAQDKVARKYFGEDIPYLGDIERNVSMLFLNVNPFLHSVRPNVPAVIELGQMHIKPKKPLPADLQKELDAATEGFVYFSMGSIVKSVNFSPELLGRIMGALSEVPYKVFWKWEGDHLLGQPKNVVIRKWFPQQDVLGHPNIKAFVTQGGLQSIEEAIVNGVPMVGIPYFGDQPSNVMKIVNLGIAQGLDLETFTKDQLKEALIEVAGNSKYRNKAREIRQLATDVPMTGLEKAVWWTEYVIRHKGAQHLRSPAIDIPWHQYLLLDVFGFVLGVAVIAIFVLYKTVTLSIRMVKRYLLPQKVKTL